LGFKKVDRREAPRGAEKNLGEIENDRYANSKLKKIKRRVRREGREKQERKLYGSF
jgi:hypothetical protein